MCAQRDDRLLDRSASSNSPNSRRSGAFPHNLRPRQRAVLCPQAWDSAAPCHSNPDTDLEVIATAIRPRRWGHRAVFSSGLGHGRRVDPIDSDCVTCGKTSTPASKVYSGRPTFMNSLSGAASGRCRSPNQSMADSKRPHLLNRDAPLVRSHCRQSPKAAAGERRASAPTTVSPESVRGRPIRGEPPQRPFRIKL